MDVFETRQEVNSLLERRMESDARNILIRLLAELHENKASFPQVVNHMIRATGLYPYLDLASASWDQRFLSSAFEVDVGRHSATLHREQSNVLSRLLGGKSLALSAPTSFGKSFIVDAFIAAKRPNTVVIIVPTIALMDETRRRLFKKFGDEYAIITAPDTMLGSKNLLVFPQERVFGYIGRLDSIDLLVVDEFYKASLDHDRDRAPSLLKAILKLSKRSKQRYYLAPNIKNMSENAFTRDMEFIELLGFNTVYLNIQEVYKELRGDQTRKEDELIRLLSRPSEKSLVYAGTYSEINRISEIVIDKLPSVERDLTSAFAAWISTNYKYNWDLAKLAERGIGVHNGNLHRCLSQIQIRLFDDEFGLDSIISTSSIIEGVNTSARNVIVWRSKLGSAKLKDFTYKNIIGRGGRMFKYFIGNIYLLDKPPKAEESQLEIELPDKMLGTLDEDDDRAQLSERQLERVIEYRTQMSLILGEKEFNRLKKGNHLQDSDADFLLNLAKDMKSSPESWRGFGYLNSSNPADWNSMLFKLLKLKPGIWEASWTNVVIVAKAIAHNWTKSLPDLLSSLSHDGIDIEEFFKLERAVTFKLAALLSDTNELHKIIVSPSIDISSFVAKMSCAFLPTAVYHLEEYGLPRMIAKKIQAAGVIDFEDSEMDLPKSIDKFRSLGRDVVLSIESLDSFDRYVVECFYEGITPSASALRGNPDLTI